MTPLNKPEKDQFNDDNNNTLIENVFCHRFEWLNFTDLLKN